MVRGIKSILYYTCGKQIKLNGVSNIRDLKIINYQRSERTLVGLGVDFYETEMFRYINRKEITHPYMDNMQYNHLGQFQLNHFVQNLPKKILV